MDSEHSGVRDHDIVNPLVLNTPGGGGLGDRRRTLSLLRAPSAHGDSQSGSQDNPINEEETNDILMSIMTPGYLMSYEGIAKSLSEMNPLLSLHAEKLNILVKVMYADKPNESRNTTLRSLLFDVLNSSMKFDKSLGKKRGKRASEGSVQPPPTTPLVPPQQHPHDQRKLIPELKQRDLRRLESHYNSKEEPYILVRRHAVLLSMGPLIRAVIQADRLFLIVHEDEGNAEVLYQLERHIDGWLKVAPATHTDASSSDKPNPHSHAASKSAASAAESLAQVLPFDCRAYEALFSVLLLLLRNECDHLSDKIEVILGAIGRSSLLSLSLQEAMSKVKHQALELSQQIKGYVKLLETILQSDEDVYAFMKLHMLAEDPSAYRVPISEGASLLHSKGSDLETLLDSMLIDYQALQRLIESLHVKLVTAEQAVSLRLDTSRNELLVASTVISVVACTIGVASVVTGAFGMNLDNVDFLQPVPGVFVSVCIICICIIFGLSAGVLYYFHCYNVLPSHGYLGWKKRKVLFG